MRSLFVSLAALVLSSAFLQTVHGQSVQTFSEAIQAMESIISKPVPSKDDGQVILEVLSFVKQAIPESAAAPASASPDSLGTWELQLTRGRFGRCRFCWIWVPIKSKSRSVNGQQSIVRDRINDLLIELGKNNPRFNRDFAVQVYAVTLIADRGFQAGAISRQP